MSRGRERDEDSHPQGWAHPKGREPQPQGGRWRRSGRGGEGPRKPKPKPPTVKQVYALAAALCTLAGQEFPRTRDEATDLIERVRLDIGHPEPSLPPRD